MKKDMEYNTGQEFEPLPDEYLQGGENASAEDKSRKSARKKMIYMVAAFSVMAYTAIVPYASETPVWECYTFYGLVYGGGWRRQKDTFVRNGFL